MENFRPDLMEPETVLVTQMLWGQTTHIGQLIACQSVNHAGLNLSVNLYQTLATQMLWGQITRDKQSAHLSLAAFHLIFSCISVSVCLYF